MGIRNGIGTVTRCSASRVFAQFTLLGIASCVLAFAQSVSTSQIQGVVRDPSGSAVPDAEIQATQTATGAVRTVSSSADGTYILPNLPIGPYRLDVKREGFSTYGQTGIVLEVASNPTIDVTLKVGAVSEKIEVEANAAMVETQSAGVGAVVDSQRILDLPLVGRQVSDLIALSGGASVGGTSAPGGFTYPNVTSFSVAGGTQTGTTYLLDGAMHNDVFSSSPLPLPFPDALQEFKVETSALPAQYGFHAGATVNAVTRSGVNAFHGSAFEFLRNYGINARQFFATSRDYLKRNQFGGTFGGPIKRDKIFFFAAYQQTVTRQSPSSSQAFVPTSNMLAGDFSTFASTACQGRQVQLRDPATGAAYANNQIPPSQINPAAAAITKYLPAAINACGLTRYGNAVQSGEKFGVGKIDYQFSPSHSIFVRYMGTQFDQANPYTISKNVLSTPVPGVSDLIQSLTVGDTYVFGGNIVNSARATFDRSAIRKAGSEFFGPADVGITMFTYLPKYTSLQITGGFSTGGTNGNDGTFRSTIIQLGDDLAIIHGKHQMSFGVNVTGWNSNANSNTYSSGLFTIQGNATGLGLADFMVGSVSSLTQGAPNYLYVRQKYLGLYAQDSWRIKPNLTLSYGVRWEPYFPQQFGNGTVDHFDLAAFVAGQKTSQFTNAPPGIFYPGDPGFPTKAGQNKQLKQLGPRVGIVWDPFGSGKTSIRASYGIFYDITTVQLSLATAQGPPWGGKVNPISPAGGLSNPYLGQPGGIPFPYVSDKNAPFPAFGTMNSTKYNTHPPYVQQWDFSIQRQLGKDWMVSGSYLGNAMVHLYGAVELNPAVYIPGNCVAGQYGLTAPGPCSTTANTNQRRVLNLLNPTTGRSYGYLDEWDDGGTQSYHGLILSTQKRLSSNYTLTTNYTWSHCIGNPVNQFLQTLGGGGGVYQYPTRAGDRGNCSTSSIDQRHIANMTAVAAVPQFTNHWVGLIASNWRASATVAIASGTHSTVNTGIDNALTGKNTLTQPPNQLLDDIYVSPGTQSRLTTPAVPWLNPLAFGQPVAGTLGNSGQGTVENPGSLTFNTGLSRLFKVRERHTLEARAEAQNVLNRTNFGSPSLTLNSSAFGSITSTGPARVMQFSMKYSF